MKVTMPKISKINIPARVPKMSFKQPKAPKPFMPRNRRYNPAPNKHSF